MQFNPLAYGGEVAEILQASDARPLAGLVASGIPSGAWKRSIHSGRFTQSEHPHGALSGLWLYLDCFDESHKISQEDPSPEGSLWHAIAHRREPDYSNSKYWYRQAGTHAVYPQVLKAAVQVSGPGMRLGSTWDPLAFVDFCEEAERHAGGAAETWALAVQRAEWEILFDYCARKSPLETSPVGDTARGRRFRGVDRHEVAEPSAGGGVRQDRAAQDRRVDDDER